VSIDQKYIIPTIKDAITVHPNLKVMICPWSAPLWMKTNAGASNGWNWGNLNSTMFATYAAYLVKVIDLYESAGIPIYAVSIQNEPLNTANSYPVMGMSPSDQAQVAIELGTRLKAAGKNTKILVFEHNWSDPSYPIQVLQNSQARGYIAGASFHCYGGDVSAQSQVHTAYPDAEIHFTECTGTTQNNNFWQNLVWNVKNLMIGATNNWARSVILWNLGLDQNSGPHQGGCATCTGVITMHTDYWTVDYNDEWYALGHFSKFLNATAWRAQSNIIGSSCVLGTAFLNQQGNYIAVVLNSCSSPQDVAVQKTESHTYVDLSIPVGLATFVWS